MAESWTTEQELRFIRNLGTYREGYEISPMRLKLLESYVKAARERVYWGNINGEQVIQFAEAQLAEEHHKTLQTLSLPRVS